MIRSFRNQLASDIFYDRTSKVSRKFPKEHRAIARRKLQYLNAAVRLLDLRAPPGNRLEMLKGDLRGFYSIRINDQWRIVFSWQDGAEEVEIMDYH